MNLVGQSQVPWLGVANQGVAVERSAMLRACPALAFLRSAPLMGYGGNVAAASLCVKVRWDVRGWPCNLLCTRLPLHHWAAEPGVHAPHCMHSRVNVIWPSGAPCLKQDMRSSWLATLNTLLRVICCPAPAAPTCNLHASDDMASLSTCCMENLPVRIAYPQA